MRIALAGNPNSGKTTMFNALTGQNEKVGNWAGVTVEKKEHTIKKSLYSGVEMPVIVDLPGAYSMSPFTSEETITSTYIQNENPDVIINIVDATNLSRSLFFTTQLLELGIPTVVALNKNDVNTKKETTIDAALLSSLLGCPVVHTTATFSEGLAPLMSAVQTVFGKPQIAPYSEGNINLSAKKAVEIADRRRFQFVNKIVSSVEKRKVFTREKNSQDKIDAVLTNKWVGIPIFAVIMFFVFQISQGWIGPLIAEGYTFENGTVIWGLVTLIDRLGEWVGILLEGANPLLSTLLVDGIIGGVGAVVGFLPLVMVMYFLIALLEDCGYMARVSVVLDPIFKRVGLSGKSVIPFVIGTGCAVPGVMACRTIRNERERRATAMLAPFMPCGAKLPVIGLFAGAFFKDASWVGTLMYFAGIFIIFIGALLINRITGNRSKKSYFIIELPEYKIPDFMRAFRSMLDRGWAYVVKAGTIILLCNTVIQIMQSFTLRLTVAESADTSILALFAHPFGYMLVPVIGYHAWQFAAAAVSGFIAKENVVATIAVCYALTDITGELPGVAPALTASGALAFLMFNLFTPPCFAAIGAMNAEMKSAKWLWGGIGLQFATGYTVSFFVYQIGTFLKTGRPGAACIPGLIAVCAIILIIVGLCIRTDKKLQTKKTAPKSAAL